MWYWSLDSDVWREDLATSWPSISIFSAQRGIIQPAIFSESQSSKRSRQGDHNGARHHCVYDPDNIPHIRPIAIIQVIYHLSKSAMMDKENEK
jgi:hypothetical protein